MARETRARIAMARVAVLGGGVAGLSAAHELIERGFEVDIYEARTTFGGKAQSTRVPASQPKIAGLPGEHGFRFFPGFYKHVVDTMGRIRPSVKAHLTATQETVFARENGPPLIVPMQFDPWDLLTNLRRFAEAWDLQPLDAAFFVDRLLVLLTSCDARRFGEYEHLPWWTFTQAEQRSKEYQKYCVEGLSRSLVAAIPQKMSTRTAGYVFLQLLFDMVRPGTQVDRVLDGPTSDVWIDPWVADLRSRGVRFHTEMFVSQLECEGNRITRVLAGRGPDAIEADVYVCAVPCESMKSLLSKEICEADPSLARIHELQVNWMNGIQIYLSEPFRGCRGHVMYADSEWALTSIAQKQFWKNVDLSKYGDGKTRDILSIDISDWFAVGKNGRTARDCKRDQIGEDVIDQLVAHLNRNGDQNFDPRTVIDSYIGENILDLNTVFVPDPTHPILIPLGRFDVAPLLINTIGSWYARPRARTKIENLFLASDYVQTHTDLATMEGANEAARHAVNAILEQTHSNAKPCEIWPPQEPAIFAPLRWLDSERYRCGLPHDPALVSWARRLLLGWQASHSSLRVANRVRKYAASLV
jgi:uncharacterized protein with NAD-binding domain and iron-sulfur cluster